MYDNRARIHPVRRKHFLQAVGSKSNIQREFKESLIDLRRRFSKKGLQEQTGTKRDYNTLEV